MSTFEVENQEIQRVMKMLGDWIKDKLPPGWGFNLMIFSYGEKGSMFYISSAKREDMIKAMKEFIERNTQ